VLGAITSTQQKLKLYTRIPDNGLVIYCGTILTDDGKEKRVNIDFEPFKPINTSLYLCDNKFHTEVSPPRSSSHLFYTATMALTPSSFSI
jgi:peptide chain release factor subunit 1